MITYKVVTKGRKSFLDDTVYNDGLFYTESEIDCSNELHGKGLVVGNLEWAKKRAKEWDGIILEVEIPEENNVIVYPEDGRGKFRVKRLKIVGLVNP